MTSSTGNNHMPKSENNKSAPHSNVNSRTWMGWLNFGAIAFCLAIGVGVLGYFLLASQRENAARLVAVENKLSSQVTQNFEMMEKALQSGETDIRRDLKNVIEATNTERDKFKQKVSADSKKLESFIVQVKLLDAQISILNKTVQEMVSWQQVGAKDSINSARDITQELSELSERVRQYEKSTIGVAQLNLQQSKRRDKRDVEQHMAVLSKLNTLKKTLAKAPLAQNTEGKSDAILSIKNMSDEFSVLERLKGGKHGPRCRIGINVDVTNSAKYLIRMDSQVFKMKKPFGYGYLTGVDEWNDTRTQSYREQKYSWVIPGQAKQRGIFRFAVGVESAKEILASITAEANNNQQKTKYPFEVDLFYALGQGDTEKTTVDGSLPLGEDVIECFELIASNDLDSRFKYD